MNKKKIIINPELLKLSTCHTRESKSKSKTRKIANNFLIDDKLKKQFIQKIKESSIKRNNNSISNLEKNTSHASIEYLNKLKQNQNKTKEKKGCQHSKQIYHKYIHHSNQIYHKYIHHSKQI